MTSELIASGTVQRHLWPSVTVRNATELLVAIENGGIDRILLAGGAPFRFDASINSPAGPTALLITRDLVLEALPGEHAVLDAAASATQVRRVLTIIATAQVELRGVTLMGGFAIEGGGLHIAMGARLLLDHSSIVGCISNATGTAGISRGGGLLIAGTLTARNATIANNTVVSDQFSANGGGMYNFGTVELLATVIVNNTAITNATDWDAFGGGATNWGSFLAHETRIEGNRAMANLGEAIGGGIDNQGTVELVASSVVGNTAASHGATGAGGGLFNGFLSGSSYGKVVLRESTIAHNTASSALQRAQGGGVSSLGALAAHSTMVLHNTVTSPAGIATGGGIYNRRILLAKELSALGGSSMANHTISAVEQASSGDVMSNVMAAGSMEVRESAVTSNVASSDVDARGGGVFNAGQLLVVEVLLADNAATAIIGISSGGALNNQRVGTAWLLGSTIVGNRATSHSATRFAIGGGVTNGGQLVVYNSTIGYNAAVASSFQALAGGISNSLAGSFELNATSLIGNNATCPLCDALGGGVYHSGSASLFIGSTIERNRAEGGRTSLGAQVLNGGGQLLYVLPAPAGRWLAGAVECRELMCRDGPCPVQPCSLNDTRIADRWIAPLGSGAIEEAYPPRCEVGSYADGVGIDAQRFPICSGVCAVMTNDPFTTTLGPGAISTYACVCIEQYYRRSVDAPCAPCPPHASCNGLNHTSATLVALPGHWRPGRHSNDIRKCPYADVCAGGVATAMRYDRHDSSTCTPDRGVTGAFCQLCATPHTHYFDAHNARCLGCDEVASHVPALLLATAIVLTALSLCSLYRARHGRLGSSTSLVRRLDVYAARLSFRPKLRIALSFYQVVTQIPRVYALRIPAALEQLLAVFAGLNIDIFGQVSLLHCTLGLRDLPSQLLFITLAPLGVALAAPLAAVATGHKPMDALPFVLYWTFFMFPPISSVGFRALAPCDCFGTASDDAGAPACFLRLDVEIECTHEFGSHPWPTPPWPPPPCSPPPRWLSASGPWECRRCTCR